MVQMKNFLTNILNRKFFRKLAAYAVLILAFYIFRDFLGIFFLTFIFSYLFLTFSRYLKEKIDRLVCKYLDCKNKQGILKKIFCLNTIIVFIYILFIGIILFTVSDLLPKLIRELSELSQAVPFLADQVKAVTNTLEEFKTFNTELGGNLTTVVTERDFELLIGIFEKVKTASLIVFQLFLSLILSLIFVLDRHKVRDYLRQLRKSNFNFFYNEYRIIFEKIVKSFGLIFKAQATIAGVNALLTIAGLLIIGAIHGGGFPYILTLGVIVFLFGFVPVFGVFLSSVPIIFVAYSMIGGVEVVIEVVLLIAIVHMIEAYYLNPKIVSNYIELPVSLTFVILIVSEHFFGIAGLLIGVSLFYFAVGLFRDFDRSITKTKKKTLRELKET